MRICLVYDRFSPLTLGGAERWYRNLAERLIDAGHDVTYLTLRQWDRDVEAVLPGGRVVVMGPKMNAYNAERRTILPPLAFGACVLGHLARHGDDYDVVHTASFPYFSLLAAGLTRRPRSFGLVVDWHEVWTRGYWREYLGRVGGDVGWSIQRAGVRIPQRAFCFSRLHAARLREEGFRGPVSVLEGEYAGSLERPDPRPAEPLVVYAGRHIPEKRVPALVPAVELARQAIPELRADVFGDGPEAERVRALVRERGLEDVIALRGFAPTQDVQDALARALCMVLPSRREGYGLVVVESSAKGVPAVVVRDPDNAATELVEDGVNGVIAPSASAEDLAAAIERVHDAGPAMRTSTADWFAANAGRLSLDESLKTVVASYGAGASEQT